MQNVCALCEDRAGDEFVTSTRGGGKVVCGKCLDELESRRSPLAGGVRAVNRKIETVAKAAQKGVQTFKDELANE